MFDSETYERYYSLSLNSHTTLDKPPHGFCFILNSSFLHLVPDPSQNFVSMNPERFSKLLKDLFDEKNEETAVKLITRMQVDYERTCRLDVDVILLNKALHARKLTSAEYEHRVNEVFHEVDEELSKDLLELDRFLT